MLIRQQYLTVKHTSFTYTHLAVAFIQSSFQHIYIYNPVAQMVEHDASNAKIVGSIPRESKSW